MKKVLIFLIIVIIICVVAFVFINRSSTSPRVDPKIEEQDQYSRIVVVKTFDTVFKNSKVEVNSSIPTFTSLSSEANNFINKKIADESNYSKIYAELTEKMNPESIGYFTFYSNYERYNCFDFVSIVVNQKIELENVKRISRKKCYVINAKDNKTADLREVFGNKTNYKDAILKEIYSQAEAKKIDLTGGSDVVRITDDQAFYIKDYKLHIYFEPGSISAEENGELDFEMPFELKNGLFLY